MNEIKELQLNETYHLDVEVIYDNDLYSGELYISNQKIELKFMFEEDSKFEYKEHYDFLSCRYKINNKINLYNLSLKSSSWKRINRSENNISFNKYTFDVEYLFFDKPGYFESEQTSEKVRFFSKDITDWLGNTNKQYELLDNTLGDKDTNEFRCSIDNIMYFSIGYNRTWYQEELSTGITLEPVFEILFTENKSIEEIFKIVKELKVFFDFIIGREIKLDKIVLNAKEKTFFYKQDFTNKNKRNFTFFPNTTNVRFPFLDYTFNFDIFKYYFQLTEHKRNLFYEFIKYRRFSDGEEKFLGLYRILEFLTAQKGTYFQDLDNTFIKRVKNILKKNNDNKTVDKYIARCVKLNDSKYNTQKCFFDFYESLEENIKNHLDFNKSIIDEIAKLRNDITHFNEYKVTDDEILKYISILEFLVTIRLLYLLNVDKNTVLEIYTRYDKFHLLRKYEDEN